MFRLGAFTDEISQDLAHACDVCNDFGVVGAELRGVWNTNVRDFTDGQVREARRIVEDHGMIVCSIGSPFGKCELEDAKEVAQHMDVLRRVSDIGLELGCSMVRGFAFWGHGARHRPWEKMLKAYEPVPAILEEKGIILGLENEAACYVGTAGDTRVFLDMLRCERIKAVWDPSNHLQDPNGDECPVFPDAYDLVRDDIVHVHVKDAIVAEDGSRPNVFMGVGKVPWERQFAALIQDGYEGFVSLETHLNPKSFPPEYAARYGQYLTGEEGEAASKVCLAWIHDALTALT